MGKPLTRRTSDGLIWNTLQRVVSRGIQFVFSVLIARILAPEQYGIIAIANLCVSLADVCVDSGLSRALLRLNQKTVQDYCSVFWFNLAVSTLLYFVLFLIAPSIEGYYGIPSLAEVIRLVSLSLVINSISSIHYLYLVAEMIFRRLAIFETIAVVLSGAGGLVCALKGMGVWALVVQTLSWHLVRTLLIGGFSQLRLALTVSIPTLKRLFSFGFRLLLSDFIARIYNSVFTLTIGKQYSAANLGLYGKAEAFASVPSMIVSGPLSIVTFPAISEIQDEKERMYKNYKLMTGLASFILIPVFIGLAALADVLVPAVLTAKWNGMIPFLRILSLSYLFTALCTIPQNYLLVLGESGSVLRIQLITKVSGLLLLIPMIRLSLIAVCLEIACISLVTLVLTILYLYKKGGFDCSSFWEGIRRPLSMSLVMGFCVYYITTKISTASIALVVGVIAGILIYYLEALLFQKDQLREIRRLLSPYLHK